MNVLEKQTASLAANYRYDRSLAVYKEAGGVAYIKLSVSISFLFVLVDVMVTRGIRQSYLDLCCPVDRGITPDQIFSGCACSKK